jgi:uncharacterized MnhB-related membrane protein
MKKFTALLLIFSLIMLSGNLYAKKRGAKLIITKKNGYQTEGELITVKPNSLLLLSITGRDVSVDIADIKVIRIVKQSKALTGHEKGSLYGLLLGGGLGAVAVVSAITGSNEDVALGDAILGTALYVGIAGAVGYFIGGIIGAIVGSDKTIQIEGMTESEIKEALEKLRKKARIRDYK